MSYQVPVLHAQEQFNDFPADKLLTARTAKDAMACCTLSELCPASDRTAQKAPGDLSGKHGRQVVALSRCASAKAVCAFITGGIRSQ